MHIHNFHAKRRRKSLSSVNIHLKLLAKWNDKWSNERVLSHDLHTPRSPKKKESRNREKKNIGKIGKKYWQRQTRQSENVKRNETNSSNCRDGEMNKLTFAYFTELPLIRPAKCGIFALLFGLTEFHGSRWAADDLIETYFAWNIQILSRQKTNERLNGAWKISANPRDTKSNTRKKHKANEPIQIQSIERENAFERGNQFTKSAYSSLKVEINFEFCENAKSIFNKNQHMWKCKYGVEKNPSGKIKLQAV